MVRTLDGNTRSRSSSSQSNNASQYSYFVLMILFALGLAVRHVHLTKAHNNHTTNNDNGVGVSFEILGHQVQRSSKLTDQQKEELWSTIQQLESTREEQKRLSFQKKLKEKPKRNGPSPYAYAFVIGGIKEDHPGYKGFIWDILVAAQIFQESGSTADIVLFVQMAHDAAWNTLPEEHTKHLQAMNVQIQYLPKPTKASFASVVMEKFRILELTQYRRVLFMDADAIPLTNLDYLFHLSDPLDSSTPTILQPNLILASRGEPCNAGVFMLEPHHNGWNEIEQIIERQHKEGKQLPHPHFDFARGWGYNFAKEGDQWQANTMHGQRWRFHAGWSDQGLLYYYTKYYKRSVSIVIQDYIENWVDLPEIANKTTEGDPKPILQKTLYMEPLLQYSPGPMVAQFGCDQAHMKSKLKKHRPHQCLTPYRDFAHFMGDSKPWLAFSPHQRMKQTGTYLYTAATALWFKKLQKLNQELNMGLDFDNWYEKHHPKKEGTPLGNMAMFGDIKDVKTRHE